jgi:hypothetical protein
MFHVKHPRGAPRECLADSVALMTTTTADRKPRTRRAQRRPRVFVALPGFGTEPVAMFHVKHHTPLLTPRCSHPAAHTPLLTAVTARKSVPDPARPRT